MRVGARLCPWTRLGVSVRASRLHSTVCPTQTTYKHMPPAHIHSQVFVLAWCPESPVWLESIGRRDAADAACLKLWGVHALMPGPDFDTTDTAAAAAAVQHHTTHTALSASSQLLLQQPLLLQVPPPGAGGFSGGGGGGSSTGPSSKASSLRGPYEGSLQASPVRRLHPQQQHPTAAEQFHLPPHLRTTNTAWDSPHAAVGSGWDGGSSSSFGGIPGALLAGSPAWTDAFSGGAFAGARPGDLGVGTERSAGGWDSLLQRQYSWMMLLALGLPLLQQASGINTVIFFSSQVIMENVWCVLCDVVVSKGLALGHLVGGWCWVAACNWVVS